MNYSIETPKDAKVDFPTTYHVNLKDYVFLQVVMVEALDENSFPVQWVDIIMSQAYVRDLPRFIFSTQDERSEYLYTTQKQMIELNQQLQVQKNLEGMLNIEEILVPVYKRIFDKVSSLQNEFIPEYFVIDCSHYNISEKCNELAKEFIIVNVTSKTSSGSGYNILYCTKPKSEIL